MLYVSEIQSKAPEYFLTPLQKLVYETLTQLQIPFQRVETAPAITMQDCAAINEKLNMQMVKTLFLCNRQQTGFYLFITTAKKPFSVRAFCSALGISRVSFAPAEQMEAMLCTKVGAATVFSVLMDKGMKVKTIFDRDVLAQPWYGCSDGTTTGYLKLETHNIYQKFLPFTGHEAVVIEV